MADDGQKNGAYQLITPPNLLKAKVDKGGTGGIDPDLIRHAENVIGSMVDEFSDTVSLEILHIMELTLELETDSAQPPEVLKNLRRVAHDLRGQGSTFRYDLITDVAECLFRYTEALSNAAD